MRCPSCNKFPSFEIGEPEMEIQVDGPRLTGTARLVLSTECCGEEAKESSFDIDIDIEGEIADALVAAGVPEPEEGFEFSLAELNIESESCEADERYADKDRNGKAITNARYRKHFYLIRVNVSMTCKYPNPNGDGMVEVGIDVGYSDEVQASGMEELT